jgi:hypothetical protein
MPHCLGFAQSQELMGFRDRKIGASGAAIVDREVKKLGDNRSVAIRDIGRPKERGPGEKITQTFAAKLKAPVSSCFGGALSPPL